MTNESTPVLLIKRHGTLFRDRLAYHVWLHPDGRLGGEVRDHLNKTYEILDCDVADKSYCRLFELIRVFKPHQFDQPEAVGMAITTVEPHREVLLFAPPSMYSGFGPEHEIWATCVDVFSQTILPWDLTER